MPPEKRTAFCAPRDETELLGRALALSGAHLAEIAEGLGLRYDRGPRAKGLAGLLLERALGATAGPAKLPDFSALGVELKTVPLGPRGRPRESTYVCKLPLASADRAEWATSWVRRKLFCVLFVPLWLDRPGDLRGPRVGRSVLWRPTEEQQAVLRADFDEIVGLAGAGRIGALDARVGRFLQARPKAASGRSRTLAFGPGDELCATMPLGFYLRARWVGAILLDPAALLP